ncbi:MAG: hypothetical protein JW941_01300 [Candidatus Coatesbacteria bacterium]|nr:hypothetical protein [Candidatus Coatesbacteria bacterium]
MASTALVAAPGYRLRGALRYQYDGQRKPALGMGLVARFGGHSAALCLALQQESGLDITDSSPATRDVSSRTRPVALLAGDVFGGSSHFSFTGANSCKRACELYDCSGQYWRTPSTGGQIDLTA